MITSIYYFKIKDVYIVSSVVLSSKESVLKCIDKTFNFSNRRYFFYIKARNKLIKNMRTNFLRRCLNFQFIIYFIIIITFIKHINKVILFKFISFCIIRADIFTYIT